jgi:hypothetical protein
MAHAIDGGKKSGTSGFARRAGFRCIFGQTTLAYLRHPHGNIFLLSIPNF